MENLKKTDFVFKNGNVKDNLKNRLLVAQNGEKTVTSTEQIFKLKTNFGVLTAVFSSAMGGCDQLFLD